MSLVLQAEFEDICEEAQLWTKLQDLEQLCQEQGLNEGEVQAEGCDTAILYLVHKQAQEVTSNAMSAVHQPQHWHHSCTACMYVKATGCVQDARQNNSS